MRKPDWLKVKLQGGGVTAKVRKTLEDLQLNTVCTEANCPNKMECYERGTATFMILGRNCTRNCTFCNVSRNLPDQVNLEEPFKVAEAVKRLGLKHAVITSVTRDDLPDQGAGQFVKVVEEIRKATPNVTVELLIPDMQGNRNLLDMIIQSQPDILNHNVETVPGLYNDVRPMADFERSLEVIKYFKDKDPQMITKSGMMLGLGETEKEVLEVIDKLVEAKCDILTLGQYLQPSSEHIEVKEYVKPEVFAYYKEKAYEAGFKNVASAPLVRSSYHAEDLKF
ncbi:MAG: lipoyl synthase [Eubacteriales bacterium]|nr:lipoyl synthase [Eubacteriales bacterium]